MIFFASFKMKILRKGKNSFIGVKFYNRHFNFNIFTPFNKKLNLISLLC